jgi:hypothetical protein
VWGKSGAYVAIMPAEHPGRCIFWIEKEGIVNVHSSQHQWCHFQAIIDAVYITPE